MPQDDTSRGILIMIAVTIIFGVQDAMLKFLAQGFHPIQIVWMRYLLLAPVAVIVLAARRPLRQIMASARPLLQVIRSLIITAEIIIFVFAMQVLPLAEAHALMASFPLIVTALSALFLGELVGARRWAAVGIGFIGVLIILRPGLAVLQPGTLIALASAVMFASYTVLTRLASRSDSAETSLIYMAVVGVLVTTLFAPFFWTQPDAQSWMLLMTVALTGAAGHFLLIKALTMAPASVLQPFNFLLLVWATLLGWLVFNHLPDRWTVTGALVIVASGLYVIYRERKRKQLEAAALRQSS